MADLVIAIVVRHRVGIARSCVSPLPHSRRFSSVGRTVSVNKAELVYSALSLFRLLPLLLFRTLVENKEYIVY